VKQANKFIATMDNSETRADLSRNGNALPPADKENPANWDLALSIFRYFIMVGDTLNLGFWTH
jgi:hypothetical protein